MDDRGASSGLSPAERRARRFRLAVIVAVVGVVLVIGAVVRARRADDATAADEAAAEVAGELRQQLPGIDVERSFAVLSAARVEAWSDGADLLPELPGRPNIDGATLEDASATPSSVTLTYRVSSHGHDRCVTGTYSPEGGTDVQIGACTVGG